MRDVLSTSVKNVKINRWEQRSTSTSLCQGTSSVRLKRLAMPFMVRFSLPIFSWIRRSSTLQQPGWAGKRMTNPSQPKSIFCLQTMRIPPALLQVPNHIQEVATFLWTLRGPWKTIWFQHLKPKTHSPSITSSTAQKPPCSWIHCFDSPQVTSTKFKRPFRPFGPSQGGLRWAKVRGDKAPPQHFSL